MEYVKMNGKVDDDLSISGYVKEINGELVCEEGETEMTINIKKLSHKKIIERPPSPTAVSEDAPKEKKWTDFDMQNCWIEAWISSRQMSKYPSFKEYIQSLQTK